MREKATHAIMIGAVLGVAFGIVQVSAPASPEILILAYGVVLVLVSMALLSSMLMGLLCGILAMICLSATEFFYYYYFYGTAVAVGLAPYSALSPSRFVVLPLSGVLGSLIGGELIAPKPARRAAGRGRRKSKAQKTREEKGGERLPSLLSRRLLLGFLVSDPDRGGLRLDEPQAVPDQSPRMSRPPS